MHTPRLSMMTALAATTVAMFLLAGGCGSSRAKLPPIDRSPLRGSEALDRDAYDALGYKLAWSSFATFDREGRAKAKAVYPLGDTIAVQDTRGSLTVLNAASGSVNWAASLGNPLANYLGIEREGNTILAVSEDAVTSYDLATGAYRSKQRFERLASAGPVKIEDLLILGTGSKIGYGHLMRSGQTGWAFTLTGPCSVDPIAASSSSVAFASDDGNITVIDPGTGSLLGHTRMFAGPGGTGDVGAGAYYVPSLDQSLYAVNTATGQGRWRFRTNVPLNRPAKFLSTSGGPLVLTVAVGQGLVAVNADSGVQAWLAPTVTGDVVGLASGKVLAFDPSTATASLLDAKTGRVIETRVLAGVAKLVASGRADGDLYAVSNRGEISKFVAR
jgi:outer membrane protein assembly factor BamB